MKKIRAFIVDDEINSIKLLKRLVANNCPVIKIVGSAQNFEDSVKLINDLKPELLYLDITLNNKTGFDVLKAIDHTKIKVIFITASNKYAIKAFRFNALDYVMKPINIEELIIATQKACQSIKTKRFISKNQLNYKSQSSNDSVDKFDFLAVPSVKKIKFISLKDLMYLESEGTYTVFYLKNGDKVISSKNLGEYELFLDDYFFRIHNSYIINLRYLRYIDKSGGVYCMMSSGHLLPVAKRRQNLLSRYLKVKN